MKSKFYILILILIGVLGTLYSMVMLIYFWFYDLFSFNFWNSLICLLGWHLFIIAFSVLISESSHIKQYRKFSKGKK